MLTPRRSFSSAFFSSSGDRCAPIQRPFRKTLVACAHLSLPHSYRPAAARSSHTHAARKHAGARPIAHMRRVRMRVPSDTHAWSACMHIKHGKPTTGAGTRQVRAAHAVDGDRVDLRELLRAPLHEHVLQAVRHLLPPPDRHLRHERQVLHQPDLVPLRRLSRADHAPLRVVQLPGLRVLALPARRAVHAPQVAQRRRKRQAVERLRDPWLDVLVALHAPVAGGEGVAHALRDRLAAHGVAPRDVAPLLKLPLHVVLRLLRHLPEQHPAAARGQGCTTTRLDPTQSAQIWLTRPDTA